MNTVLALMLVSQLAGAGGGAGGGSGDEPLIVPSGTIIHVNESQEVALVRGPVWIYDEKAHTDVDDELKRLQYLEKHPVKEPPDVKGWLIGMSVVAAVFTGAGIAIGLTLPRK